MTLPSRIYWRDVFIGRPSQMPLGFLGQWRPPAPRWKRWCQQPDIPYFLKGCSHLASLQGFLIASSFERQCSEDHNLRVYTFGLVEINHFKKNRIRAGEQEEKVWKKRCVNIGGTHTEGTVPKQMALTQKPNEKIRNAAMPTFFYLKCFSFK